MPQLLLTLVLIGIGWFLLIRPQQARVRAQRTMVESLEVGDRIITAGGIHGKITELSDETATVDVAEGVSLTVARAAIGRRINEPAAEAADQVEEEE